MRPSPRRHISWSGPLAEGALERQGTPSDYRDAPARGREAKNEGSVMRRRAENDTKSGIRHDETRHTSSTLSEVPVSGGGSTTSPPAASRARPEQIVPTDVRRQKGKLMGGEELTSTRGNRKEIGGVRRVRGAEVRTKAMRRLGRRTDHQELRLTHTGEIKRPKSQEGHKLRDVQRAHMGPLNVSPSLR